MRRLYDGDLVRSVARGPYPVVPSPVEYAPFNVPRSAENIKGPL